MGEFQDHECVWPAIVLASASDVLWAVPLRIAYLHCVFSVVIVTPMQGTRQTLSSPSTVMRCPSFRWGPRGACDMVLWAVAAAPGNHAKLYMGRGFLCSQFFHWSTKLSVTGGFLQRSPSSRPWKNWGAGEGRWPSNQRTRGMSWKQMGSRYRESNFLLECYFFEQRELLKV